jgi:hypothetical protein
VSTADVSRIEVDMPDTEKNEKISMKLKHETSPSNGKEILLLQRVLTPARAQRLSLKL